MKNPPPRKNKNAEMKELKNDDNEKTEGAATDAPKASKKAAKGMSFMGHACAAEIDLRSTVDVPEEHALLRTISAGRAEPTVDTIPKSKEDGFGGAWWGGALHPPSGRIYYAPFGPNAKQVLVLDPATEERALIGPTMDKEFGISEGLGAKFVGAVLANDGCIYLVPCQSNKVVKVDPISDTVSALESDLSWKRTGSPEGQDKVSGCD